MGCVDASGYVFDLSVARLHDVKMANGVVVAGLAVKSGDEMRVWGKAESRSAIPANNAMALISLAVLSLPPASYPPCILAFFAWNIRDADQRVVCITGMAGFIASIVCCLRIGKVVLSLEW